MSKIRLAQMMSHRFKRDIAVVCSAGGHLAEAITALEKAKGYDMFYVTKNDRHVVSRLTDVDVFFVNDPHTKILAFIKNAFLSFLIFSRTRPRLIVSTGSGIALAFCLLGKMFGSKIIFIETGARVNSPSRTGKFMYRYSDIFYIQWPGLLKFYPKAVYVGRLI